MYVVLELQVNNGACSILPAITKETRQGAESEYHRILSFAAISDVEKHSAIVLDEFCTPLMYKCYEHETEVPDGETE